MGILIKRLFAFLVDYAVIIIYAGLLFVLSSLIGTKVDLDPSEIYDPLGGQLIGFLTLTLPVFLYAYFFERSHRKGTLGKRLLHLKVNFTGSNKFNPVLTRNVLKFLPWEIAHTGIHWMFYFISVQRDVPIWVWILLVLPQVTVFAYLVSLFFSSGKRSLYDRMAGTQIIRQKG